jgi:hypothetical protein
LTCTGSQAEYVYRLNSLFDPDQTGVGGQPDGFDQLKALYGRYRVIAVDVEVQCAGQSANGLLAIAPSDTAGGFLSAEEIAGLRYAKAAAFTATQNAKVAARYHIGKLLGYSDEAMLGNSNVEAAISGNPSFQQYLIVAVEGGTSSTQTQNIWVKLTYYARMEVPIAVNDSLHRAKFARFVAGVSPQTPVGVRRGDGAMDDRESAAVVAGECASTRQTSSAASWSEQLTQIQAQLEKAVQVMQMSGQVLLTDKAAAASPAVSAPK